MAILKGHKREELGTRKVRHLRAKGLIPGIIYGHGEAPLPVTLGEHDIEVAILHGERLIQIDLGGQPQNVLIKDVQYDTFGHEVLHVDLTRVSLDERVEVTVRVVLRGTPAGATEDGVLQQATSEVSIECVVTGIPEEIRASVNEMKVGDLMTAAELPLPHGARLLTDPETPICTVSVVAEEAEAPAEAEAAPEVIGEKPGETKPEGEGKPGEQRPSER